MIRLVQHWLAERKCRQGALPDAICHYIAENRVSLPKSTPIEQVRFVVLDTETTGLNPATDEIISLAAVGVHGCSMNIEDSFEVMLQTNRHIPKESIEVHEILPFQSSIGSDKRTGLRHFLSYLGSAVIVAHHAPFDTEILNAELKRTYGVSLLNKYIDTVHLTRRVELGHNSNAVVPQGHFTFDEVSTRYNIQVDERHTAAGDAFATALLLLQLLNKLKERKVRTLGELLSTGM